MPDNWDDILAEPIASLGDPVAAVPAEGEVDETVSAWLAVQELAAISPRAQGVPVSMPAPDSMLLLRMPVQAETQDASAKLPPSLADQLSLTWAARRRHRFEPEPEAEVPLTTPRPSTPRSQTPAPAAAPEPTPAWRKPFEAVARVLARPARPEREAAPVRVTTPLASVPDPATEPRSVVVNAEPLEQDEAPAPRAVIPGVPLTLATPQQRPAVPETSETPRYVSETARPTQNMPPTPDAPSAPRDLPLSETPVIRAARIEQARSAEPVPQRVETSAELPATIETTETPVTPQTQGTPTLAPRHGLLSWLLPRRAPETPEKPQAPVTSPAARPVTPRVEASEPRIEAPQPAREPTLAQALPIVRNTSLPPSDDAPFEPTPAALQDAPPEVALTYLLRQTQPDDAPDAFDAETVRETLTRMVEATPATEPARVETFEDQGEALPAVLRERMEGLLDVPLHEVRIFRGQVSQRLAERMQADAVTIGNQIHAGEGQADPSLPSGRALIAHEVTHYATHRVETEGPAATLSGSQTASGEPTWPQFTGIAPEPGAPAQEAEETLALRIEHAMSRPEAFDGPAAQTPGQPAAAPPLSLQHRAPPPQIIMAPGGVPGASFGGDAGGFDAGGFGGAFGGFGGGGSMGGGGFGGGTGSNGGGVGMAPWDRIAGGAESAMSTASGLMEQGQGLASQAQEMMQDGEDEDDEDSGKLGRIVDAVLRRIKHDEDLDADRRGAFRA